MYYVLCVIMYEIYYGRCICVRATYYGTCTRAEIYIFLMLLKLTVHIYIHARIYITVYHLLSYIHARIYIYSHIYMQGYTLRFIIYYLILLNLTLADPHIELILARLSYPGQHQHHCQQHHPKSCNLITNHTPPSHLSSNPREQDPN